MTDSSEFQPEKSHEQNEPQSKDKSPATTLETIVVVERVQEDMTPDDAVEEYFRLNPNAKKH